LPQQASDQDPDDSVAASQEEQTDQPVPKDTHDNVSAKSATPSNITITSDTPAGYTSNIAAGNTIPTTPSTLDARHLISSCDHVPPPISVSSIFQPSVTYVHSLGPPLTIPRAAYNHNSVPISANTYK